MTKPIKNAKQEPSNKTFSWRKIRRIRIATVAAVEAASRTRTTAKSSDAQSAEAAAMMSADEKVSILVLALTEAAQGAGLPQERAEAVYTELMERYGMMREGFADALIKEVERIVKM